MNIWDQVRLYLPGLRRQAVNITGSLNMADKYLEQMLHSICDNPNSISLETTQLDLYKSLLAIWRQKKRPTQIFNEQSGGKHSLAAALLFLEPEPRYLILLNKCEGFNHQECSYIMNMNLSEIKLILSNAADKLGVLTSPENFLQYQNKI